VAEVASIAASSAVQIELDPNKLRAYNMPLRQSGRGGSQRQPGTWAGRLVEMSGAEYMVRGRGYARSTADLGDLSLTASPTGVPVRVRGCWGRVTLGPDLRRGRRPIWTDAEMRPCIVVVRQGENALNVIERVKAKLEGLQAGLPKGVKSRFDYDRVGVDPAQHRHAEAHAH